MTIAVPALGLWEIARRAAHTEGNPHRARYFPLGLPSLDQDYLVRGVNSVLPSIRSSTRSNRIFPCRKPSVRGVRLREPSPKSPAAGYFQIVNRMPLIPQVRRTPSDGGFF